ELIHYEIPFHDWLAIDSLGEFVRVSESKTRSQEGFLSLRDPATSIGHTRCGAACRRLKRLQTSLLLPH
ncbi:unnamed protein product, partial [Allacma fusca]